MAVRIQQVSRPEKTQQEREAESLQSLLSLVAENKDSLEHTIRLIEELNDSGILEALVAMLTAKEKIAQILVGQALRPEATALINNMMSAMGSLTKFDAEVTASLMSGLAKGMSAGAESMKSKKKIGVFELGKALKDPDINRTLKFGIGFLKGFGKSL